MPCLNELSKTHHPCHYNTTTASLCKKAAENGYVLWVHSQVAIFYLTSMSHSSIPEAVIVIRLMLMCCVRGINELIFITSEAINCHF